MNNQAITRTLGCLGNEYSVLGAHCSLVAVLFLLCYSAPALAREPASNARVATTVGVEGVYYLRDAGETIAPRHVEHDSPILLRIADTQRDGDATFYEIRFIGNIPGSFDLRDYLQRASGDAVTDVAAANVQINSLLPADHSGELLALSGPGLPWPWPYRVLAVLSGIAWLAPAAIFVLRRWRRKLPSPALSAPAPTLVDRLLPLVAAAIAGHSSIEQLAQLERMLLGFWQARLGLESLPTSEALEKLRAHPEAGRLLRSLTAWLHEPPGRGAVDVHTLLAPYQSTAVPSPTEVAV